MRRLMYLLGVAALPLLAPGVANAGLIAEYSLDGGSTFTTICTDVSGGACGKTFTVSGLSFTLFGTDSNSPGDATGAETLQSTVQVHNTSGSTQSIEIVAGDTGFTTPTAPPPVNLVNNISGTVLTGGAANLFSSEACIGTTTVGCPGTHHTPTLNANITAPGVGANNNSLLLTSLSAPFSLSEMIMFTLASGANINYSASAAVQPVAEPASLALLGVGMVGIGFIRHRRRNSDNTMGLAAA